MPTALSHILRLRIAVNMQSTLFPQNGQCINVGYVYIGPCKRIGKQRMASIAELPITAKYAVELFGEETSDYADLISAIYCMHHEFATKQLNFSKQELRVEYRKQEDECVVTVRGGVGVDTRVLTSSKMQELMFECRCRNMLVDAQRNVTMYTISHANKGANYLSGAVGEDVSISTALVKHNTSRNSLALATILSNRRMQRTINLYTRSNRQIAEFDVFLQTSDSDRCIIMTITNVAYITPKFMFELLRDPVTKIVRAQHCTSPDDDSSYELRLWFDCTHTNPSVRKLDEEVNCLKSHKKINQISRLLRQACNPY